MRRARPARRRRAARSSTASGSPAARRGVLPLDADGADAGRGARARAGAPALARGVARALPRRPAARRLRGVRRGAAALRGRRRRASWASASRSAATFEPARRRRCSRDRAPGRPGARARAAVRGARVRRAHAPGRAAAARAAGHPRPRPRRALPADRRRQPRSAATSTTSSRLDDGAWLARRRRHLRQGHARPPCSPASCAARSARSRCASTDPTRAARRRQRGAAARGHAAGAGDVACALVRPADDGAWAVELAAGGHPPALDPARRRRRSRRSTARGRMLGDAARAGPARRRPSCSRSGDTLLLYTDGIIDARPPGGRTFGERAPARGARRAAPGATPTACWRSSTPPCARTPPGRRATTRRCSRSGRC